MMEPFKVPETFGPEAKIEADLMGTLRKHNWFVKKLHGNAYQSGMPDLFCAHFDYGIRFIEVKYKYNYTFTKAQQKDFPAMEAAGVKIWILTGDDADELAKLFKPYNWHEYYYRWQQGIKFT